LPNPLRHAGATSAAAPAKTKTATAVCKSVKAVSMTSGLGVMCCLFGSVAAFGSVYYIYFGKR